MSTIDERRAIASDGIQDYRLNGTVGTRVFLQPIAAPSILGLFGFAAATFMVAANLAGWYGNHTTTPLALAPFAFVFGGIGQFMAGMWAYRARDGLATAMHGMWGSFWIAYGLLQLLVGVHVIAAPTQWYHDTAFGFWFFALAVITGSGALAALAENLGMFAVLGTLCVGSALLAGALIYGTEGLATAAGWVLVASAIVAWYVATAMMLAYAGGRTILPLGKYSKAANKPGERPTRPIELEWAEPGIKMGQ
jgi:succinate-acetate transporter protein